MITETLWLYDVAGIQVAAVTNPPDFQIDERLQQSETLTFSLRADDAKADYLGEDLMVRYGTRRYRTTALEMERAGSSVKWHVSAEALWIDLLGFPATATTIVGLTISQGLTAILSGTGWTGTVEGDGGNFSLDTTVDNTALALLRVWATMTGREIVFDTATKNVALVLAQGADRGLGFRYGRNLTSVKRKSEPPIATRLYPVGAADMTIAGVNPTGLPYIDNFAFYTDQGIDLPTAKANYLKVQRWVDNRYLLALNLYDAGVRRLAGLAAPRISYTMAVVDLSSLTGGAAEVFAVGDTVRVDDAPTGISLTARIVRKTTKPLQPADTGIELSFLEPGLSSSATSSATSAGGGSQFSLLLDLNSSPLNVGGSQINLATISLGVDTGNTANAIFGLELDATATGTGTVTVTFWYGATQVGPTAAVPFTAGPVHVSVPDFLAGITTSNAFIAKAQVTSGTGTLAVPLNGAHMYVLGTGLAGGGSNSSPEVTIAEPVVTRTADAYDITAVAATLTPIPTTFAETVVTTPDSVTETVTAVPTVAASPGYRASTTTTGSGVTSLNVAIPAPVRQGDLLLLAVCTVSSTTHTTPTGWTLLRSDTGAGTSATRQSVFWRRAIANEAGVNVTCSLSASSNVIVTMLDYVTASGSPINVHGGSGSGADGTTATAPSVTTTVNDCTIIEMYAEVSAAGGASITAPATSRVTINNGATLAQATADQALPVAGASGTQAATQVNGSWVAQTIAVAP